jgi:ribose 5-phosphate isomerase A
MNIDTQQMKRNAARAALAYLADDQIIGIGSGSTVNIFIEELALSKRLVAGAVASSNASAELLRAHKIPVLEFTEIDELPVYIDGADAFNALKQLVKGGGGALTREKILAYAAREFICLVDDSKKPGILGRFPVAIEVIPMARSYVAREIVKLGGRPEYRGNFTTDNGNIILDVHGWEISQPLQMEEKINQITGVVENGIFARHVPKVILIGNQTAVTKL